MSKTKQALPEDVDVTDPRDTGAYPGELVSEMSAVDNAQWELMRAISVIEKEGIPLSDIPFMTMQIRRLAEIVEKATRPF